MRLEAVSAREGWQMTRKATGEGESRMTRRAFVGKTAKVLALVVAALVGLWLTPLVIGALVEMLAQPQSSLELLLFLLMAVVAAVVSVAPPMVMGMVGAAVWRRRPGLAGAIAGGVGCVASAVACGLTDRATVVRVGPLRVSLLPHDRPSWVALLITLAIGVAWWAFFGNVGGRFLAGYRAGRRGNHTNGRK